MNLYPQDILDSLDFPFIRQRLSQFCSSAGAKEKVAQLQPYTKTAALREALAETDEILALLQSQENFPSAEHPPLHPFLAKLKIRGFALKPAQIADLRSAAYNYAHLHRFVEQQRERLPALWLKMAHHLPEKIITTAIDGVLDDRAEVRANASPALARIRRELVKSRAAADRIFQRLLKKYRDKGYLVDFDESVSDQRRVLAIQASYKGQVQGIYHSSSQRQSIAFIEPGETVEINNYIAELLESESEEIERILRELCQKLAPYLPYLQKMEDLLQWLDFSRAKALFARREKACVPRLLAERRLKLKQAYNPVLRHFNAEKGKTTVPLDLELHPEQRLLIISGPNAGGKSLSLKTVGLLQIMLQSGLAVPVHPESEMCFFEDLMGDIGDAQSIENELSTYSSKLQKMEHFLRHAHSGSLLLIDEFGSGSDPELGSALAQVFLEKLQSFGCYGIANTHFNAIKALAAKISGVVNGAMLFDRENFDPQYLLQVGNPGSSYTFEVAQRSGIAVHLIAEARARTAQNILAVDQLLVQIQEDKLALGRIRRQQSEELEKLRTLQDRQRDTIARLEEKLSKQKEQNQATERSLYWGQRFQKLVESWMNQKSQKDKKAVVARFVALLNQRAGEREQEEQQEHGQELRGHQQQLQKLIAEELPAGTAVRVIQSGLQGTLLEPKGDKYVIALGGNMRAVLEREKFVRADASLGAKPQKKKRKKSFAQKGKASGNTSSPAAKAKSDLATGQKSRGQKSGQKKSASKGESDLSKSQKETKKPTKQKTQSVPKSNKGKED